MEDCFIFIMMTKWKDDHEKEELDDGWRKKIWVMFARSDSAKLTGSHLGFFFLFFFFSWFDPFPEFSSSRTPFVSGHLDTSRSVCLCLFCCRGDIWVFMDPWGDTERWWTIWEVVSWELLLLQEDEHLDCWVADCSEGFNVLISVLEAVKSVCSRSTPWVRRTRDCTVSVISSVAAAIFVPRTLMSLVLLSMELAASRTVILNSSRLSCLASSTGFSFSSRRGYIGLGGAVWMRGLWRFRGKLGWRWPQTLG